LSLDFKLVDGWINNTPKGSEWDETAMPVKMFPGLAVRFKEGRTTDELVAEMDEFGVERGVVCAGWDLEHDDMGWAINALERFPDRFVGSLMVDPFAGMAGVRQLETCVKEHGFKMARIAALRTMIPYNDPRCYPLYAKCVELDIPISINVGIPGPLVGAAKFQDPINLDGICADFPELKVIMAHGGDPWTELCVKLMRKWKNLYYMTSAFTPKHVPKPIIDYMNGRGSDRIMWASDYPLLGFDRCAGEIENEMTFRDDETLKKFGRDNALRVIFGES
jgi:predicted TIM-barrel fold metal-dependent hydrolase